MPKIPKGYVLQPRIFDGSDASKMSPVTRELWFYILRNVNHSDSGKYKKGQAFFSFSDIQEALSWYVGYRKMKYSKPQLTKSLRRLCEGNMTATAKATRGIIISVCNYSFYQCPSNYEGNGEEIAKEPRRKSQGNTKNKNVKELKKKEKELYTPNFLSFWKLYPKKTGKGGAFKAYQNIKNPTPSLKIILESIKEHQKSEQWENKQFIPNPATWLNQRRWEDEVCDGEETMEEYKKRKGIDDYGNRIE